MNIRLKSLAIATTAAAMLVGCGSDEVSEDDAPETQTVAPATPAIDDPIELAADPDGALEYDKTSLEASAGTVAIDFTNESSVGHDVVIERDNEEIARTPVITESSETVSFEAEPGEYTFYCSVPGHEEAGMVGTLTVSK